MVVKFHGQKVEVETLQEASGAWATYRDSNGLGASDCAGALVLVGDRLVARISYNGKVWPTGMFDEKVTAEDRTMASLKAGF